MSTEILWYLDLICKENTMTMYEELIIEITVNTYQNYSSFVHQNVVVQNIIEYDM